MMIDELRDLVSIRMAVILVPTMRALDAHGRGDLRAGLRRFLGPLERDLEEVLSRYDVRRKDDWQQHGHV